MREKFFVTTPIYYVNGEPHLGTLYTTIAADIISRYKRFNNFSVFFLTGTDEHGEKVEESAKKLGVGTKKYVDDLSRSFKESFKRMNISYDRFIRTTDKDHLKAATFFYKTVQKKGDIFKGVYEGWYCISCESFFTEKELINKSCPDCGKKVKLLKEDTLFFRQSKYQDKIIRHIKDNPGFILPESRRNEILSFLKKPLKDLSISRTSFKWGLPVPGEKKHILYVWFDALINYLTASGYPLKSFQKFWPADLHLMGKEITRFHCITWPAMLLSAGLKMPKQVFGHGWWTIDAKKMSKSVGNVVYPDQLCKKYNLSVDSIRYVLFKQMPFGNDGDFSEKIFVERVNNELGSELGNLVSRTLSLLERYNKGIVPKSSADKDLKEAQSKIVKRYHECMNSLDYYNALNNAFELVYLLNKYVADTEPWKIEKEEELFKVLYNLSQGLNSISALIYPFMPETSDKIDNQLGVVKDYNTGFNNVKFGTKTIKKGILFPKIELFKPENEGVSVCEPVSFEDFKRVNLRVGTIIGVSDLSDKLYKIVVKADKERTLVAGIKQYYSKEELKDKQVIILVNLEPKKIKGVVSEGMMLAAEKNGKVSLLTTDKLMFNDSEIK